MTLPELVPLRRLGAGQYVTLDGRYQIERQDGQTECEHPLCDVLHERFHSSVGAHGGGGWVHYVSYVAWHVWDNEINDYLGNSNIEVDTKREAHRYLTNHLHLQQAKQEAGT
jgi:hypothetical protein